jgi:hypothetical protein
VRQHGGRFRGLEARARGGGQERAQSGNDPVKKQNPGYRFAHPGYACWKPEESPIVVSPSKGIYWTIGDDWQRNGRRYTVLLLNDGCSPTSESYNLEGRTADNTGLD